MAVALTNRSQTRKKAGKVMNGDWMKWTYLFVFRLKIESKFVATSRDRNSTPAGKMRAKALYVSRFRLI
tara:strand:- start:710 stop:916 length:207 start_codon:yes stop_codon:yes gene_type:complete